MVRLKYWWRRNVTYRKTRVGMSFDRGYKFPIGEKILAAHGFEYLSLGRGWFQPLTTKESFFNEHINTANIPKCESWSDIGIINSYNGVVWNELF
jgi:hypothetical protein